MGAIVTVAELMSVLSEMDETDVVVIGHPLPMHSADMDYTPAADSVYKAIVDIAGEPHNCVVIDMDPA